jgi:hypothetical protein
MASGRRVPLSWVTVALLGAGVAGVCSDPLGDPDVWWHIRVGQLIGAAHAVPHHDPLSIGGTQSHWVVTSWLSDLLYGTTYDAFGYRGVQLLRVVCAALVLAALAWTLRHRRGPVRTLVFLVTAVPLISFLTERPQLFSFVFVAWLADRLPRVFRDGALPRWWTFLPLVWLWANVHGLWVLAPILLCVAALAAVAERGRAAFGTAGRCVLLAAGSVVAAALTPVGWRLALQPFAVGQAARTTISEWLPSALFSMPAVGVLSLLALLLVAWARGTWVVPRGDLVWTLALLLFAVAATRNLATGAILLAPVVALHLERTFPPSAPDTLVPAWALALVGVAGIAGIGYGVFARPSVSRDVPRRLVAALQAQPRPLRVVNGYDVGGLLIGPDAPDVRPAVDGRTDLYRPAYLKRYLAALHLNGDWEPVIRGLDARYAVLPDKGPLAHVLRAEWGWREVTTESGWALLAAP